MYQYQVVTGAILYHDNLYLTYIFMMILHDGIFASGKRFAWFLLVIE